MTFKSKLQSLIASAVFVVAIAEPARAEETPAPPAHLAAYGLDWLNYIVADDLPPGRPATCIVDTGTLVTLDTPEAAPVGPILERLAIDGGPGTPQGADPKQLHGTRMTMAAVAPANGWGTIGAATWSTAISVRAQTDNQLGFAQDAYRRGILKCQEATSRHTISAISLSLGCDCIVGASEEERLNDVIAAARSDGISVIAAAGNTSGAGTGTPARLPGVVAVAAGAPAGGLCDYASFDSRVDVIGPACPIDGADPLTGVPAADFGGGSSAATVLTATLITALRTLRPDATADQAEAWVRDSARLVDGRRVLDGAAAARQAGMGDVVDRARARMPAAIPQAGPSPTATPNSVGTPTASPTPQPTPAPIAKNPRPRRPSQPSYERRRYASPRSVAARWHDRRLVVRVHTRQAGARLQVTAEQVGDLDLATRRAQHTGGGRRTVLPLRWRPDRVLVRFVARREFGQQASKPRILQRVRSGRFR